MSEAVRIPKGMADKMVPFAYTLASKKIIDEMFSEGDLVVEKDGKQDGAKK